MIVAYYKKRSGKIPVKEFLDSLEIKQKAKVLRILLQIQKYGLTSVIPHIKKLTCLPLWEIRILGKDNIRIIYILLHQDLVFLLHGFTKKSNKTPTKEVKVSINRYYDWKQRLDR